MPVGGGRKFLEADFGDICSSEAGTSGLAAEADPLATGRG